MGYDIYAVDENNNEILDINITTNYNEQYLKVTGKTLRGILHGNLLKDTEPILLNIVDTLGVKKYIVDGFKATPGNAGAFANSLLPHCRKYPNARWTVNN